MQNPYRLTSEMVPETSWYRNLRSVFPRAEWDRLRRQVYAQYGHRCGICGARGRLNCHEIWKYDDEKHTQTLSGLIALCDLCHFVKHLGFARILSGQGRLDFERVVRHFMRVNRCRREDFLAHEQQSIEQWQERSRHAWEVILLPYEELINTGLDQKENDE